MPPHDIESSPILFDVETDEILKTLLTLIDKKDLNYKRTEKEIKIQNTSIIEEKNEFLNEIESLDEREFNL